MSTGRPASSSHLFPGGGLDAAAVPTFTAEPGVMPDARLPEHELAPDLAHQLVHGELMLDGNARLTSWFRRGRGGCAT